MLELGPHPHRPRFGSRFPRRRFGGGSAYPYPVYQDYPDPQILEVERTVVVPVLLDDDDSPLGDTAILPATKDMLLHFTLAAGAGALIGRSFAGKHPWQSTLLGAAAVMMIYGIAKENVLKA